MQGILHPYNCRTSCSRLSAALSFSQIPALASARRNLFRDSCTRLCRNSCSRLSAGAFPSALGFPFRGSGLAEKYEWFAAELSSVSECWSWILTTVDDFGPDDFDDFGPDLGMVHPHNCRQIRGLSSSILTTVDDFGAFRPRFLKLHPILTSVSDFGL